MGRYLCKCHQRHSPSERNNLRPLASTIMVTAKVLPAPFSLVPCLIDHVDTWQPGSHCFLTESPYGGYSALPLWEIHLLSIMPFGQNLLKKKPNQTKPHNGTTNVQTQLSGLLPNAWVGRGTWTGLSAWMFLHWHFQQCCCEETPNCCAEVTGVSWPLRGLGYVAQNPCTP